MHRRILVPLDGSKLAKRVLPFIPILARGKDTDITLLRVIARPAPHVGTQLNPTRNIHRTLPYRIKRARKYLLAVARVLRAEGLNVECEVREGVPGPEIVKEAMLVPGTLVAISTHGRYGVPRLWFGSILDEVLHKTEVPMFIVGPHVTDETLVKANLEREVVALDGSGFAESVLPHALGLARSLGLEVVLAKVTPAEGLYHYEDAGDDEEEPAAEDVDVRAEKYLAATEEKMASGRMGKAVLHGMDPSQALVRYAGEAGGSMISLATHARIGVGRGLMGSVADTLIHDSPYPLLVLHVAHHSQEQAQAEPAEAELAQSPQ